MRIRCVPIEDVKIAETNMRDPRMRNPKMIEIIQRNIETVEKYGIEVGLLYPPLATSNNEVFEGGSRLFACERAGKKMVPLRIMGDTR